MGKLPLSITLKKMIRITFFSTLLLLTSSTSFSQIKGYVIWVNDGDTFKAKTDSLGEIKIRMADIDSPELNQEFGKESKEFLTKMIWKDSVRIYIKDKDKYNRFVCFVFNKDTNINQLLIQKGYAWHFKQYSNNKTLAELEDIAKRERAGLWANDSPIAPWEFRKIEKLKKTGHIDRKEN